MRSRGDGADDGSGPRPIKEGLDGLARRLGAPDATALSAVFSRWEEAVGPGVAANAQPRHLAAGVLTVAVTEPGWATQLRFLSADLVERLAEVAGTGVVTAIEVKVEGLAPPPRRPPFRRRP